MCVHRHSGGSEQRRQQALTERQRQQALTDNSQAAAVLFTSRIGGLVFCGAVVASSVVGTDCGVMQTPAAELYPGVSSLALGRYQHHQV
jgi:hypothetical protein